MYVYTVMYLLLHEYDSANFHVSTVILSMDNVDVLDDAGSEQPDSSVITTAEQQTQQRFKPLLILLHAQLLALVSMTNGNFHADNYVCIDVFFVVRLPFSGLLSCTVTTAMKEDSDCLTIDSGDGGGDGDDGVMSADVRRYLCDVTCALLQQQSDPLPLCLLVARHAQLFTGSGRILHKLHRFLPPKLLKVRIASCGRNWLRFEAPVVVFSA